MSLLDTASLIVTPNGYKASKLYSVKPTSGLGDMTVVRATTATRVNSAKIIESVPFNAPRLDYPPLGGCPRILVEPIRTNWVLRSEEIGNWSTYNAIVSSNHSTSPDGTQNADLVYPSITGGVSGQVYRNIAIGVNLNDVVTVSAFVKSSNKNFAYIAPIQTASFNPAAWFNLTTGAITNVIVGATASITEFANGWWRISVTTTATAGSYNAIIGSTDIAGNNTNTASGTNGILVWGAQVEIGTTATSYIPTTTIGVTRNADSIIKTGITNLIGQTEGTLFVDVIGTKDILASSKFICIIGGTKSIHIAFYASVINIVSSPIDFSVSFTPNVNYKIAVCYSNTGNFRAYVNGVLIQTLSTYTAGTFSALGVGQRTSGDIQVNSNINSVQLYKTALTPDQCIALTTP